MFFSVRTIHQVSDQTDASCAVVDGHAAAATLFFILAPMADMKLRFRRRDTSSDLVLINGAQCERVEQRDVFAALHTGA